MLPVKLHNLAMEGDVACACESTEDSDEREDE